MNAETILPPAVDEAALERLEAEFLLGDALPPDLVPGADLTSLQVGRSDEDDLVMYMTRYRTRRGCCG